MCRNIKKLRRPGHQHPTEAELHDAALQFVRKISGFHKPSELNREVFETAVKDIAGVAGKLFRSVHVHNHSRKLTRSRTLPGSRVHEKTNP